MTRPHFLLLGYSSLLDQCLRLVSYATGALPHLRLRAFRRRSSLPSLCYRIAGNSHADLLCETAPANVHHGRGGVKRSRLLDLLSLTKRREESKSGCDRHQVIAWAVQLRVDFADCKTSLSHHGRQISESESEAQGTATGESQKRDSEERATGLSRQGGPEKEVGGRCQAATNLGSVGGSAQLSWGEGDLQRFDNGGRRSGRHGRETRRGERTGILRIRRRLHQIAK